MSSTRLVGSAPFFNSTRLLHSGHDVVATQRGEFGQGHLFDRRVLARKLHLCPLIRVESQLVVQLETAHPRQVVPLRVEKQAVKEIRRRIQRREDRQAGVGDRFR